MEIEEAFAAAVSLRQRVDAALAKSKANRDGSVTANWVPTMTRLIMLSQELREQVAGMDEIASAIAAAIEEQNASTEEISRNVAEASTGSDEVSRGILVVKEAAGEAGSAASQVVSASGELGEQANTLKCEVANFLERVRAG